MEYEKLKESSRRREGSPKDASLLDWLDLGEGWDEPYGARKLSKSGGGDDLGAGSDLEGPMDLSLSVGPSDGRCELTARARGRPVVGGNGTDIGSGAGGGSKGRRLGGSVGICCDWEPKTRRAASTRLMMDWEGERVSSKVSSSSNCRPDGSVSI